MNQKDAKSKVDVITLSDTKKPNIVDASSYIIFKNNKLQKTNTLVASTKPIYTGLSYVSCDDEEN